MHVVVFLADGVADFGLAAVLEVLNTANSLRGELDNPPRPWRVDTVGLGTSACSGFGCRIPTTPISALPARFDLLVVPAVSAVQADSLIELVSSPDHRQTLELIADAGRRNIDLAAACTGTFFLAEAGVLDEKTATTSWWLSPTFRRRYPNVTLRVDLTLCRSDRITTAGAALSHLDLALSLVNSQSPALAELVTRYMMIGNRSTQLSFIIPELIARGDPLVAAFERWVRNHLSDPFRISTAAHVVGVTERTLQRATAAELGMSPREFINAIRLEQATRILQDTNLTVDAVAAKVGYRNGATLRGLIQRNGMTVTEIRAIRPTWKPPD